MIKISADNVDNSNNNRQTEGREERDSETAAAKQVKQPAGKSFQFPPCHRTEEERGEREGEGKRVTYVGKPFQQLRLTVSLIC